MTNLAYPYIYNLILNYFVNKYFLFPTEHGVPGEEAPANAEIRAVRIVRCFRELPSRSRLQRVLCLRNVFRAIACYHRVLRAHLLRDTSQQ